MVTIYDIDDAARIERAYFQLPANDTKAARCARWAFRLALDLCRVSFVCYDERGCHPFSVKKPGGVAWSDEERRALMERHRKGDAQ